MRFTACIPLLVVIAACGGEAEENVVAPKASSLTAGEWELASEVTTFETLDEGEPKIDAPVGTRTTERVCVAEGRPPAALFAGEGYRCRTDNFYLRGGRINVTMQCARDDLSGSIPIAVDGTFEAESLEYSRDLSTVLSTDGDVHIVSRVTGRRIGECPPDADGDNSTNAQDG